MQNQELYGLQPKYEDSDILALYTDEKISNLCCVL